MDFKKFLSSGSSDPKKILTAVLGFAAVMLVLWLLIVSRMDFSTSGSTASVEERQRADSLRSAITQNDGQPQRMREDADEEAPNIFFNAFTTFLVLLTLLGLVWFWSRSKGGETGGNKMTGMFEELGGQALGQGARLKVVEVNEEIWVMGVTENNVNLLHRYSREEWKVKADEAPQSESSFYKLFNREKQS